VPDLTLSLGVIPANMAISDIALKLHSFGYISAAESIGVSLTTFTYCATITRVVDTVVGRATVIGT